MTDEILALAGGAVPVHWRRSARARRVSLRIDPRGHRVVVTLPARGGRTLGLGLLRDHAGWIAARLAALPAAIAFADGAEIPLGDERLVIRHRPDGRGGAWREGDALLVAGDIGFLPRRVADFLRAEARRRLAPIVADKARRAGVVPRRLALKDTSTRWGSCAADGTVMLSWRLVMAPMIVQDYVAAHEVAHLRHMDHGPAFWALTRALSADADRARAWLGRDGGGLLRIG